MCYRFSCYCVQLFAYNRTWRRICQDQKTAIYVANSPIRLETWNRTIAGNRAIYPPGSRLTDFSQLRIADLLICWFFNRYRFLLTQMIQLRRNMIHVRDIIYYHYIDDFSTWIDRIACPGLFFMLFSSYSILRLSSSSSLRSHLLNTFKPSVNWRIRCQHQFK